MCTERFKQDLRLKKGKSILLLEQITLSCIEIVSVTDEKKKRIRRPCLKFFFNVLFEEFCLLRIAKPTFTVGFEL